MNKLLLAIATCTLAFAAHAAPTPSNSALAASGDGLNVTWVDTASVHSLADANLAWSDPSLTRLTQVVPFINHTDGTPTHIGGGLSQPAGFASDDNFVVRYTGFLNVITGGSYTFRAFTDDGFEFRLGGESVMSFVTDRSPSDSAVTINLTSGLYALDFLVWEQGGQFVSELDWIVPGDTVYSLVPTSALFTSVPQNVPEPGVLALFGAALAALGGRRRRSP